MRQWTTKWHERLSGFLAGTLVFGTWVTLFHVSVWLALGAGLLAWLFLWHKARYVDRTPMWQTHAEHVAAVAAACIAAERERESGTCRCGAVTVGITTPGQLAANHRGTLCPAALCPALDEDRIPGDTVRSDNDWERHVDAVLQDIARHQRRGAEA